MAHKRCTSCGARWTLTVDDCPFCGGRAEDRAVPPPIDDAPLPRAQAVAAAPVAVAPAAARRPWWKFWT
jgi:hypothetical protein